MLKTFVFNSFQVNTYVLYDETNTCVIIDPGCHIESEKKMIYDFIREKDLKPERILNTHAHLDHICGNAFLYEKYGQTPECHQADLFLLRNLPAQGKKYDLTIAASPEPDSFLEDGQTLGFGHTELKIFHIPGHSPGGLAFYAEKEKILFSGDSLFRQTIGRTDLPGGDQNQLIKNIKEKIFQLKGDVTVYPGHGEKTTIREEKSSNPFF